MYGNLCTKKQCMLISFHFKANCTFSVFEQKVQFADFCSLDLEISQGRQPDLVLPKYNSNKN